MKKTITVLSLSVAFIGSAHAATLTGSVNTDPAGTTNLTTDGTLDWAVFNGSVGETGTASIAASNTKAGGAGLIGDITAFGTGAGLVRHLTAGNTTQLFTYTDGTSPTTLTSTAQDFAANSTLSTAGAGVQLSITGAVGQLYQVDIWAVGFGGTGTLTASLNNANGDVPLELDSQLYDFDGANKEATLFSFLFTPDDVADLLSISYALSFDNHSFSHVGIQAVTVTAIPEPGTYALIAGCLALGAVMVRRRRA